MLEILGVPFDRCGRRAGSSLGPAALRVAGLKEALAALGLSVADSGDVPIPADDATPTGIRHFGSARLVYASVRAAVLGVVQSGRTPIVLGGDHSVSIGSVSAALEAGGEDLAVLWIDAHADINTPEGSPSGNLHGMPISVLLGRPTTSTGVAGDQWRQLAAEMVPNHRLAPARIGWIGLRDVDVAERAAISSLEGAFPSTMQDVDLYGLRRVVESCDRWLRSTGATKLWISFDVDVLDPILAPGTGTAVRGGLSYREGHLLAELLCERLGSPDCPYRLMGLDVVETNPLEDAHNETAKVAVEWVCSLFGKTILGRPSVVG